MQERHIVVEVEISILTSEIISLMPHAHFAVCTHGDWPDLSAVSERYHVIL